MKLSFLLLSAWLWVGVAGAALMPTYKIVIRTNAVDSPAGPVSVAGSTTAGIAEAFAAMRVATNFQSYGGGVIDMAEGDTFNCTTPLNFNQTFPFKVVWHLNQSTVRYIGTVAQDFITTTYNPSFSATNTFHLTVDNGTISYASNYTQNIVNIGGSQYLRFINVNFAKADRIYGVNAFQESDFTTKPGLVGVFIKSAQNPMTYFRDCNFSGLADGINCQGDELIVDSCVFVGVGAYYNSGWVYNDVSATGKNAMGAAIIFDSNSGSCWAINNEYANVGAALGLPQAGNGVGGRAPHLISGSIAGGYRVLTVDGQACVVDSLLSGANNGDGVLTNNAVHDYLPSTEKPNTVFETALNAGGAGNYLGIGVSSNAVFRLYSSTGDMTNSGSFSTLGGSAVFDATAATATNYFRISGWSANCAVLNGKFYPTNCPASVCADAGSLLWTNAANGAYVLFDPLESCVTDDDWEWHNNAGTLLGSGNPFGPLGSVVPNGAFNGGSGSGSGTNPGTFYLNTTRSLSSPKAVLPQVVATNGFIGNGSGLTNLPSSEVGVTDASSATAGNVGQIITSSIASGSATSLTTATAKNVTSISLTAGDWDVSGNVNFSASTATVTGTSGGISTTSATVPTDGTEVFSGVQVTLLSETDSVTLPRKQINVSSTTTVYLVGKSTFSAGAVSAFGSITARRVR